MANEILWILINTLQLQEEQIGGRGESRQLQEKFLREEAPFAVSLKGVRMWAPS